MRTPESPSKIITFSVDPDTLWKLNQMVKYFDRSRSDLIREAVIDLYNKKTEDELRNQFGGNK